MQYILLLQSLNNQSQVGWLARDRKWLVVRTLSPLHCGNQILERNLETCGFFSSCQLSVGLYLLPYLANYIFTIVLASSCRILFVSVASHHIPTFALIVWEKTFQSTFTFLQWIVTLCTSTISWIIYRCENWGVAFISAVFLMFGSPITSAQIRWFSALSSFRHSFLVHCDQETRCSIRFKWFITSSLSSEASRSKIRTSVAWP